MNGQILSIFSFFQLPSSTSPKRITKEAHICINSLDEFLAPAGDFIVEPYKFVFLDVIFF
jgi:hypothetical protein